MASFLKNTLKLVSGSIIAQTVAIILIPVITRIYTPDDFGVFQLFISISGTVAIISSLSYQFSIMLPEEDTDAATLTVLCFILTLIITLISGFFIVYFSDFISSTLNTPLLSSYLIIAPFVIFLNGTYHILNYWLSRRQQYGGLAIARVGNSVTKRGSQMIFGIWQKSPLGLISGTLMGFAIADFLMLPRVLKDKDKFCKFEWKRAKNLALRYKKFPAYTTLSTLSNQLSLQVSPFMLAFFFSPAIVGLYSIANQVVNMPASLIGSSISQVFFQRASEEKNRTGNVKKIVQEVHKRLVLIGIFPMLLLVFFGEEMFGFFLGDVWYEAGLYAKILAPWFFMVFIASPLSAIFSVLERQGTGLFFNFSLLISRIIALFIGGISGNPIYALILFSGSGVLFWGWMNLYILRISGVKIKDAVLEFLGCFKYALTIIIPIIVVQYFSFPPAFLIVAAVFGAFIYYSIIIRGDPALKKKMDEIIKGKG